VGAGPDQGDRGHPRGQVADSRQPTERLLEHEWCRSVRREYFGLGVGGVLAVFCFEIDPAESDADRWLWIVVGDLPPAYLVPDFAATATEALSVYCEVMQEWVDAVREGDDLSEVFPVRAEPTEEHVAMLESRLEMIRGEIIPAFRQRGA
jgi:hypothetical protein